MKQCKFIKVGQGDERQMDNYKIACLMLIIVKIVLKLAVYCLKRELENIPSIAKITRYRKYIPGEFYKRELPGILEVYWKAISTWS